MVRAILTFFSASGMAHRSYGFIEVVLGIHPERLRKVTLPKGYTFWLFVLLIALFTCMQSLPFSQPANRRDGTPVRERTAISSYQETPKLKVSRARKGDYMALPSEAGYPY